MPTQMQRVAFGEYLPDLPSIANPGLTTAKNTVTGAAGYSGLRGLSNITAFSALDSRPRGGIAVVDPAGNPYNFAGTETKLYRLFDATFDASRTTGGAYMASETARWEFASFGNVVIAVNPNDDSQYYTLGSSTSFDQLGNSTSSAPRAAHVGVVGSFLMLGNTFDTVNGQAENAIHWSAIADPFNWPTLGSDAAVAVQSDRQVLEGDGGAVQAVATGSEVGAIFQERAIWRADYRGGDVVFQLNKVDPLRGLLIPGLAVPFGRQVFYLSEDGFYLFDYSASQPIGRDRVDKTFLADIDTAYLDRVSAVADSDNQRIWVSYPGAGNTGGRPNKLLIYDWGLNRWSHGELEMELLVEAIGAGVTLDAANSASDPDAVDTAGLSSFDARLAGYGARSLGAYDSTNRLSDFTGTELDAVLETGRREMTPGYRSLVSSARPLVESVDPTIQVAGISKSTAPTSFGPPRSVDTNGSCALRRDGRFHAFRVNLDGGFSNAVGLDVNFQRSASR